MLFLSFSNADMQFIEKVLKQESYKTAKVLPTTKRVELVDKQEFVTVALNKNAKTFVIYVATLSATLVAPAMQVYSFQQAQVRLLLADKAIIDVFSKYSDYANIFSFDLAIELSENMSINEHAIKLIDGKQSPYGPIYTLSLVELKTLKTYIETILKTGFI